MRIFVDLLNDVLLAAVGRYVVRMDWGKGGRVILRRYNDVLLRRGR